MTKTASPRSPDTERPAALAALPFRLVPGIPALVEYEDTTTIPVRYTPTPQYRTLSQKYRIRADERPGKQIAVFLSLYREAEQALAQCMAENERLTRELRESQAELASEKARVRSLKDRAVTKG